MQFYYDYSVNGYEKIIENGYPINKIIVGSISSLNFDNVIKVLKTLKNKYKDFAGAFNWEYFDSPPNSFLPGLWSYYIYTALYF